MAERDCVAMEGGQELGDEALGLSVFGMDTETVDGLDAVTLECAVGIGEAHAAPESPI